MEAQSYYVNNTKDPLHPKQLHAQPKLQSLQHEIHESSIPFSEQKKHEHIHTKDRIKNKIKGVNESIHDQYYLWTSHHKTVPPITKPMVRKEGSDVGKIELNQDEINKLVTKDIPRTQRIQSTKEEMGDKVAAQDINNNRSSTSSTSNEALNKLTSHKRELPDQEDINQSLKSVEEEIENEKSHFINKKKDHKDDDASEVNSGATHEAQEDKKEAVEQELSNNKEHLKRGNQ